MKNTDRQNWLDLISNTGDIPTPYMLTDLSVVRNKVALFRELLPNVELYYALKSNNDLKIVDALKDIVDGFDIASVGEYRQLIKAGVKANDMLYSNPVKVPSHIDETYVGGVRHFALDSVSEIDKLKQYAPGSDVYLRLKVSDYGSKFPLSGKFGLDPIHTVTYAAAARDAGLSVKGLAFHVGSQSENPQAWDAAFKTIGKVIKKLAKAGINIEFVDMGGGMPADYEELAVDFMQIAPVINAAIEAYLPKGIRVMAEPGRFISANSSVLVTSVIGREHRRGTDWLYLDMGVFQGLLEPLEMSWKYPIFNKSHTADAYKKEFVLTGPSCDAYDTLGLDYLLPADINVGDRLYIGAVGAYSLVYGSNFNGFEVPKTYYVNEGGRS